MKLYASLTGFTVLFVCLASSKAYVTRSVRPTLYIAGDSTAAKDDGTPALLGWGEKIGQYISIPVVNNAISGATTRSFTEDGNFTDIANAVKPGDIVIIEFGHNDGSTFPTNPTGDCPGDDLTTTCNDNGTTIYTFKRYLQDAADLMKSRQARVIISSQTPDNPYAVGFTASRFVQYAADIATANQLSYLDHFHLLLETYAALGENVTDSLFPLDQHVHTSPEGADYVAQAVARGALCDQKNPLRPFVTNTTVLPSSCVTG